MKVSSLNFHFESPPIFTARQHGQSRWIEVRDADATYDAFAIFIGGDQSFGRLTVIAARMNAAWSEAGDPAAVAAEREG